jgi:hypothetical protein
MVAGDIYFLLGKRIDAGVVHAGGDVCGAPHEAVKVANLGKLLPGSTS